MAEIPADLRYTNDHEWVRAEGDRWRIGVTQFAVQQLGDITLVELPRVGADLRATEPFGTIESVKSVSELYAPVSGKVTAVNGEIDASPELVNQSPYGDGWLIEVEPSGREELEKLLTAAQYEELLAKAE